MVRVWVQPLTDTPAASSLSAIAHAASGAAQCVLLAAAVWLAGFFFLSLILRKAAEPAHWPAAYGLGLLAHSLALTALGWLGWLSPAVVRVWVGAAAAAGVWRLHATRCDGWPARGELRSRWGRMPALDRLGWACLAGVVLVPGLLSALTPSTFYDSLVYHFALPDQWLKAGGFIPFRYNLFSAFPMGWDVLNVLGLAFSSQVLQKAVLWGGLAALAGTLLLWGGTSGWVPALLFTTMPALLMNAQGGGVEVGTAVFLALAWGCLLRHEGGEGRAWLALGSAFAGAMLATKYNAAMLWIVVGAIFFWRTRTVGFALGYGAGALVVVPWLAGNWRTFGNPLYPFFEGELTRRMLSNAHAISGRDWLEPSSWARFLQPWAPYSTTTLELDFLGIAAVWALPALWPARRDPQLRLAVLAAGLGWMLWGGSSAIARFLLPATVMLFAALAFACRGDGEGASAPPPAVKRGALLVALVHCGVSLFFLLRSDRWKPVLGVEAQGQYLSRDHHGYFHPYAPVLSRIQGAPPGVKILLVGEARSFYLPFRVEMGSGLETQPLAAWAEGCSGAPELRERLRREGISHLLLNVPEAARLQEMSRVFSWSERGRAVFEDFWQKYPELLTSVASSRPDGRYALFLYRLLDAPRPPGGTPRPNPILDLERFVESGR